VPGEAALEPQSLRLVRFTGSDGPSGSNSFDEAVESKELNPPAIVLADEGWARVVGTIPVKGTASAARLPGLVAWSEIPSI